MPHDHPGPRSSRLEADVKGLEANGLRHRAMTPRFLRWSEVPITFDCKDHLTHLPRSGRYPLVVKPIVQETRLIWVLMDGGKGLNILYIETLDRIGID